VKKFGKYPEEGEGEGEGKARRARNKIKSVKKFFLAQLIFKM